MGQERGGGEPGSPKQTAGMLLQLLLDERPVPGLSSCLATAGLLQTGPRGGRGRVLPGEEERRRKKKEEEEERGRRRKRKKKKKEEFVVYAFVWLSFFKIFLHLCFSLSLSLFFSFDQYFGSYRTPTGLGPPTKPPESQQTRLDFDLTWLRLLRVSH